MTNQKIATAILAIIFIHANLLADIAPNPIKAKSISPKEQTSIRMESEQVIIDLYNDSSVVKCLFNMKNLGAHERLQIGFPEMSFYYYQQNSKVDETNRFQVTENGKAISFDFSDSLKHNEIDRKKAGSYPMKEAWYLWESEFQPGETKTIEVQYSLPFGMLYKTNERFFTYLLSTGANWKGTIGKAEIMVNLKDIEMDSIEFQKPDNCIKKNKQLIWTFTDIEPTANEDIKVQYHSNKILYKGSKTIPPVCIVDGILVEWLDLEKINPNDIASVEVFKNDEDMKYTMQHNGVIKIYTKNFVLTELNKIVNAKAKEKVTLPEFDKLKEAYCLFINGAEADFTKVTSLENKAIAKVEIVKSKDKKSKIMVDLK